MTLPLCPVCEALGLTNLLFLTDDGWWCCMHPTLPRDVVAALNRRYGLQKKEPLALGRRPGRAPSHQGRSLR